MSDPILTVEGLDVFYGPIQALRRVGLSVGEHEMVALFGANGAGKTTTLRAISGLVPARTGRVMFDGIDITGWPAEKTAAAGIAHIPEGRGIFTRLSVWQNLKMGGYVHKLKQSTLNQRIEESLDRFPALAPRLQQAAGTMSGGEQQMLAIARSLIGKPRLLMLDEPSHGLAPLIVREVFALLAGLRQAGVSLLVVEQYASVALSVADRCSVLERGTVALEGTSEEMRSEWASFAGAYLGA